MSYKINEYQSLEKNIFQYNRKHLLNTLVSKILWGFFFLTVRPSLCALERSAGVAPPANPPALDSPTLKQDDAVLPPHPVGHPQNATIDRRRVPWKATTSKQLEATPKEGMQLITCVDTSHVYM